MKNKKILAVLLVMSMITSVVPVSAAGRTIKKKNMDSEWICAEDAETVSEILSENIEDDHFVEAVIDIDQNRVSVDGKKKKTKDVFGSGYNKNNGSANQIVEYLERSGYEIKEKTEDKIVVSSPYQSKRILVFADDLRSDHGAEYVIHYPEYQEYILQFATIEETKNAYERMKDKYDCYVDRILTADVLFDDPESKSGSSGEDDDTNVLPETEDALSWGRAAMGIDASILDAETERDVTVAVIDSGLSAEHEMFDSDRIDKNSYDLVSNDTSLTDTLGHGTAISGIIEECTPDNVSVLALRVFNDEGITTDSLVCTAIQYAIEHDADLINMSFGGTTDSMNGTRPYDTLIDAAYEKGILCVCAAGNAASDVSDMYPANNEKTVAVSSHDSMFRLASTSNYGSMIDFSAPGVDISCAQPSGSKDRRSGTSYAAPHVSAALACILSFYTDIKTCEALYDTARLYVNDIGEEGRDAQYGWGVFDLSTLYEATRGSGPDIAPEDHAHQYESRVIEPTCTGEGYTLHICSVCNASYKDSIVPASGHVKGNIVKENITAGTCQKSASYDQVRYCRYCDTELSRIKIIGNTFGDHQYGDWEILSNATCTEKGKQKHTCLVCGHTEIEETVLTEHVWADTYTIDVQPTCSSPGSRSIHCIQCQAKKDSQPISKTEHNYVEKTEEKEAACTETGAQIRYRVCTVCGEHQELENKEIPACGHSWNGGAVTKVATKDQDGVIHYKCTKCNAEKNVVYVYSSTGQLNAATQAVRQPSAAVDKENSSVSSDDRPGVTTVPANKDATGQSSSDQENIVDGGTKDTVTKPNVTDNGGGDVSDDTSEIKYQINADEDKDKEINDRGKDRPKEKTSSEKRPDIIMMILIVTVSLIASIVVLLFIKRKCQRRRYNSPF